MTPTPETVQRYRTMAAACLRDALQPEMSIGGRSNAAFDAGYMYCRIVMAGDDGALQHPTHLVLIDAWSRLGFQSSDLQPAVRHLRNWYAHEAELQGAEYDALVALAWRLEAATLPR